jgi:hypothetical protein
MRLKAPRWLLILEAVLLSAALMFLAYKAATRVLPLPLEAVEQARRINKPDPQAQLLEYYRQYPDRYLRISDEKWAYNPATQTAIHSFTLRNIALAAYAAIEVNLSYESASGKVLLSRTIKIEGPIAASATMEIKNKKVAGVPATAKNVVTTVAKAAVVLQ